MKILIQKFGGTSVVNEKKREVIAKRAKEAINSGYKPVIVVSALGRKGDPYSTDTLFSLINGIDSCLDKREIDLLLCCGELISAVVTAETLKKNGLNVTVLTGGQAGIVTNNRYGNADILKVDTDRIFSILDNGQIPIVTGFQGSTSDNELTTLGRGASDTTAAVLGYALKAEGIEIYTDVDGIMTADPRIVPDAKVIDKISYNEVFQFAAQGAKVIHPRAVEYAMKGNVPLYIKNTMSDAPGTVITSSNENPNKIITGITHMPNRTQICVYFNEDKKSISNNYLFNKLAENNISIDLINVFPDYKAFTIDGEDTEKVKEILISIDADYKIITNCSKLSAIGNGMKGIPGVMAKILTVLCNANIEVLQTADSHNTIWCLVRGEDTVSAIQALHRQFE